MGEKCALIINNEGRMAERLGRAVSVLEEEGYETFVASSVEPTVAADHYVPATMENLEDLLRGLRQKMGEDGELFIYVTAHGEVEEETTGICLQDRCYENLPAILDQISYGQRTVIMDQCYGGNLRSIFEGDRATFFASAGDSGEIVSNLGFAEYFWAGDVPDLNGGGVSWMDRFHYAALHTSFSSPQYYASPDYVFQDRITSSQPATVVSTDEERLSSYLQGIGDPDSTVSLGAITHYLDSTAEVDPHVLMTIMERLYGILERPDENSGYGLLDDVFEVLARKMEPYWLENQLDKIEEYLWDADVDVRFSALTIFNTFLSRLDSGTRHEYLPVIERMLTDSNLIIYASAGNMLRSIMSGIGENDLSTIMMVLRLGPLIEDYDYAISEKLGMIAAEVMYGTTVTDESLETLRRLQLHPNEDIRRLSLYLYLYSARHFSGDQAEREVRSLREIFTLRDLDIERLSADEFGGVTERLDIRRRSVAAEDFERNVFPQSVRWSLLTAYGQILNWGRLDGQGIEKETQELEAVQSGGGLDYETIIVALAAEILALSAPRERREQEPFVIEIRMPSWPAPEEQTNP